MSELILYIACCILYSVRADVLYTSHGFASSNDTSSIVIAFTALVRHTVTDSSTDASLLLSITRDFFF